MGSTDPNPKPTSPSLPCLDWNNIPPRLPDCLHQHIYSPWQRSHGWDPRRGVWPKLGRRHKWRHVWPREIKCSWEFHQLSLLDQTRTRVAWELTSESLHKSFINFHCLIKREQGLHESWQAKVYIRVSSTFIAWSNENKGYKGVDKRKFT